VDTEYHLIVTPEVTNTGSDRSQLANIASQAKAVLGVDHLDAVANRGYFNSTEILAYEQAGITVTLPKPMTSGQSQMAASASTTSCRRRMSTAVPRASS